MNEENYLKTIVEGLTKEPEAIEVKKEIDDDRGILLVLRVAKTDMPAIVGKMGMTVKSIKRLLWTFGANKQMRLNLKLEEPQ